jgi:hypothetical protein
LRCYLRMNHVFPQSFSTNLFCVNAHYNGESTRSTPRPNIPLFH